MLQVAAAAGTTLAKYAPDAVKKLKQVAPDAVAKAEQWYRDTIGANRVDLTVAAKNPDNVGRVLTGLVKGGLSVDQLSAHIPVLTQKEMEAVRGAMFQLELEIRDRGDRAAGGVISGGSDKVRYAVGQRMIKDKVRLAASALGAANVDQLRDRLTAIRAIDENDLDAYATLFGTQVR